jgi:phage tail sheath protein FI
LNAHCYELFVAGALQGQSPAEAYFVKCDEETNPREERDSGRVFSLVGFAAVTPAEFIVVRISHTAAGTTFIGPSEPGKERR